MKDITLLLLSILVLIGTSSQAFGAYDDKGKRDPFWPLVSSGGAIISYDSDILATDMVLEGIIAGSGENNLAIINGIIVKQKEKVGQYIIAEIDKNSVILIKGNEKFELKLKKED